MPASDPIDGFIDEQPAVIAAGLGSVAEQLAPWSAPAMGSLVLVGSGSSLNALTVAQAALQASAPTTVVGPRALLGAIKRGMLE
jgi:glucosamine--fructose-6-phosphate aminotransferase (isomerizing)